jgi:Tfp pilus assembly protein PilF
LLQLAYKRAEAEAMIAETLERAPHVNDAETLLAEIYRQRHAATVAT